MQHSNEAIESLIWCDLHHLGNVSCNPEAVAFRDLYAHVRRRQLQLELDGPKLAAFNVALDLMQAEFPGFEPEFDLLYFAD
jgi:hypothetical protein